MRRYMVLLGLICFGLTSCYIGWYPPYYYNDGYYDPYYYGYDGWFVYGWVDPYSTFYFSQGVHRQGGNLNLDAMAATLAAQAGTYYTPAGCASARASGASVSYTFANCGGHFGVQSISGTATVSLSDNNGQLVLETSSSDITVDGKTSVLDFTATVTSLGTERVVTIDSHSFRPDEINSRHSQGTISWSRGSGCINVTGQGSSASGNLSASASIDSLQLCEGHCPASGTVTVTGPDGAFQGTFTGSNDETVTDKNGKTRSFTITCQ